ncbi:hypothetical protein A33K_15479 [Burkholderia humptydooensis MSMB43]|uniref:Uncharacterized protein n=1 Tax=Burkholderia humptydooensis MSMB43 TaxID=441157 RepID=A0ABN0G5R0_9BURK|nr:hypothetical protein A33K_15479 [Burkholderia humptydooensis MSMB43]
MLECVPNRRAIARSRGHRTSPRISIFHPRTQASLALRPFAQRHRLTADGIAIDAETGS